jgi:hypothetical protein
MTVSQQDFRIALLDPEQVVPGDLTDGGGNPVGARFSVYRNNVVVSLTDALATAFPLVRNLIGPQTFSRLAAVFVRAHPPSSPLMMFYGEALPGFLEAFGPLAHLGYLSDCARLDLALRQSYHAADSTPLDPARLQGDPSDVLDLRLALAPSTRVIRSRWPLYDLWRYNTEPGAPKPRAMAQDVLITRPEYDPEPHLLAPGTADWLDALDRRVPLGRASEEAALATADFDLSASLSLALETRALVEPLRKDT